jgi:hypothetical protein
VEMHGYMKLGAIAVAAFLAGQAALASSVDIEFRRISEVKPTSAPDAAGQLKVTASDGTCGGDACALFRFELASASPNPDATITQIYFDDRPPGEDDPTPSPTRLFLPPPSIVDQSSTGVRFDVGSGAGPGNLPAGERVDFVATSELLAVRDTGPGGVSNGINWIPSPTPGTSEFLILGLKYAASGINFNTLLASLRDSSFRIGMHVQSLNSGGSDSFVSTPIPLPVGAWLALTAAGGLVVLRRRKTAVAA